MMRIIITLIVVIIAAACMLWQVGNFAMKRSAAKNEEQCEEALKHEDTGSLVTGLIICGCATVLICLYS